MSDGGQVRKPGGGGTGDEEQEQVSAREDEPRELLEDVDELLDEIDEVLEENAEEFVRSYVQKGGE